MKQPMRRLNKIKTGGEEINRLDFNKPKYCCMRGKNRPSGVIRQRPLYGDQSDDFG